MKRACLVALALLAPSLAAASERYAVVVGTNVGGGGVPALRFAEEDAERVADVLVSLGSVAADRLTLLRSPTRAQIDAALVRIGARARAEGGDATVIFYYSGHALPEGLRLGRDQLYPYADVKAAVEATGAGVRLLFFDSCFAGVATREKGATRAPGFLEEARAEVSATGEVVIASSASDEASQESDAIGGSYFTHYLVSALRGAGDTSGDGAVTLEEAYRYVYHRTVAHTATTRAGAQHPSFDYDLRGSGDVVLTRMPTRGAALLFPADEAGRYLVFDDAAERFVAEVAVVPGRPARLMVEAGRYRVQRRDDDALREQRFLLRAGAEGTVDELVSIPYTEDVSKGAIRRTVREAEGREVALYARVGGQGFLDPEVRAGLVPPSPLGGAELEVRGLTGPLGLRAEVLFGTRPHDAAVATGTVPLQFSQLQGGLTLFVSGSPPGARALRPHFGVRASLLWLHRDFLPPLVQADQDYLMLAPGLAAGLQLAITRRLRIDLQARAHLMVYVDDGDQEALGYVEGVLGVGVAF